MEMVAIEGGAYNIGINGPNVQVSDFWMAKYETTWDQYLQYADKQLKLNASVDAVARPTPPYVEMSFGQGKQGGFPVCNVTQYAARAFCKWLSEKTGEFYRLPTEAEWEWAARDLAEENIQEHLKDYAWFYENSNGAYKKVGLLKPNAHGIYDLLGNVAEWTGDAFMEEYYPISQVEDPWNKPKEVYPHTIKGGHWDSDLEECKPSYRTPSSGSLKQRDPQVPKSDWWLTNAPFLGFRVVKPVKRPSKEFIEEYFSNPPKDL